MILREASPNLLSGQTEEASVPGNPTPFPISYSDKPECSWETFIAGLNKINAEDPRKPRTQQEGEVEKRKLGRKWEMMMGVGSLEEMLTMSLKNTEGCTE